MAKLLSLLCFFLLFATFLQAKTIPQSILDGFFEGRSSPVVISPKTIPESDSVLFLNSPSEAYKSDSINDKDVADLISHLMGTSPLKIDVSRTNFPQTRVFESPRANLLVVFDSLGEDTVSKFPSFGQKIGVKHTSFPRNSLSKLTTISTGVSPSVHGIVSSTWFERGHEVDAFSPQGQSAALNLADVLNSNFHGVSRIVVISSDRQMASALSPQLHTLRFNPSWNNHVVHWNKNKKASEYIVGKRPELSADRSMIVKSLKSNAPFGLEKFLVKYNEELQVATVQIQDLSASFHLNNEEELSFLAELELVHHLHAQLHALRQARILLDDSPDYYAVVFSSIKPLIAQHGAESNIVKIAIHFAHSSIERLMDAFQKLYDQRVVSQVLYLGSEDSNKEHPFIQDVTPELLSQLSSGQEVHQLTSIHHHTLRSNLQYDFYLVNNNSNNSNNGTNTTWITTLQVAELQMPLWVSIGWVLIALAFVYALGNVSSGRDTLLYASGSRPHAN